MTKEGYREMIREAVNRQIDGHDERLLESLSEYLAQIDQAKQILSDKGYGWVGLSLLDTVKQIP